MFDKFLKQYVQDLIECSDINNYEITEDNMEEIITNLENNEYMWSIIDEAVYQEIDRFRKEEQ